MATIDGNSLKRHIENIYRKMITPEERAKIANLTISDFASSQDVDWSVSQLTNIHIDNVNMKDEDDMASNSALHLASQQSIKAYVDSQVDTVDTLSEILAIGNTTGGTKIEVDNTSGGIDFIDNAKLRLGTGDDNLEIYQDGTNSFIQVRQPLINSTAGILYINAPVVDIGLDADTTESGDVKLRNVSVFTGSVIKDEDNMASNSSSHLATQQSIKAYADTKLPLAGGTLSGALTVGVDDTGYDVKFFGATSGKYMLWDESLDALVLPDDTKLLLGTGADAGIYVSSDDLYIDQSTGDKDIIFKGTDGVADITALTLDMSDSGAATFTGNINAGTGLRLYTDANGHAVIYALGQDKDLYFVGDDGGTGINALVFDMSDHGKASFNGQVNIGNPGYTSSNPDGYMKGAGNNGTAGSRFQVTANSSDNTRRLWLGTSHTEAAITITEDKVGIGTTTLIPAATKLHLFDSAPELRIQDGGDKASNASGYLSFYDHDSLMMNFGVNDGGAAELNLVNNAAFTFKTNNSVALTLNASQNATFTGNIRTGTSTLTANTNFDNLVIEGSAHTGITIFSGTSSDGGIYFGDSDANNLGQIKYLHGSNAMTFATNDGSASLTLDSGTDATFAGNVGVGMAPDSAVALTVSGQIGPTNGTAAAPTHTFYSDDDTGMYRSAANALSFSTSGTLALTFDSSQNAIFTASANIETGISLESGVLVIKNATSDSNGLRIFQDSSDASKIYNNYNGTLQLGVGNTTAITIDSSENTDFAGNVDIGGNEFIYGSKVKYKWTNNMSAVSGQDKKYHIMRVYFSPNHWSGEAQDIEIELQNQYYSVGSQKYRLQGWYGMGNGNSWKLWLQEINSSFLSDGVRFARVSLGTVTDAGWDYSSQNVYYQDVYVEVNYYLQVSVTATFNGHGYQTSNPTSGGAATVVYTSPTSTDITYSEVYTDKVIRNFHPHIFGDHDNVVQMDDAVINVGAGGTNAGISLGQADSAGNYRQLYVNASTSTVLYFWNGTNQASLTNAGAWTDASDEKLKKDIKDLTYGLDEVLKLKPREYKMKADNEEQIGFVAQEVETVIPEVVDTHDDPKGGEQKSLAYSHMTAVLTKAIQELEARVKELENK